MDCVSGHGRHGPHVVLCADQSLNVVWSVTCTWSAGGVQSHIIIMDLGAGVVYYVAHDYCACGGGGGGVCVCVCVCVSVCAVCM